MSKATKARERRRDEPSAESLRAMPEIDFSRYTVRRNPFAERVKKEGVELVHESPSSQSLAEMPERDLSRAVRRSPYAARIRAEGVEIQVGKGRPRRGQEVGPTPTRSIRLPQMVWDALEALAEQNDESVHALMRAAVAAFLERAEVTRTELGTVSALGARWACMFAEGEAHALDVTRLRQVIEDSRPSAGRVPLNAITPQTFTRPDHDMQQIRRIVQELETS